jgi:hypothetical protein
LQDAATVQNMAEPLVSPLGVGRSAVDATGHGGVMGQADGACVVSAAARQATVGFGGCLPPGAQIALQPLGVA